LARLTPSAKTTVVKHNNIAAVATGILLDIELPPVFIKHAHISGYWLFAIGLWLLQHII
jgi:hypothetical protein